MPLFNDRNSASFDSPEYQGLPKTCVVLASEPRVGSTLLLRALEKSGAVWNSTEFFNPVHRGDYEKRWGQLSPEEYVAMLMRYRTTPQGVFCIKAHFPQFKPMAEYLPDTQIIYVRIQRTDLYRQAISLFKARLTQAWSHGKQAAMELREEDYDFAGIQSSLEALLAMKTGNPPIFSRFEK
jgi:LPS sulfotransferase NodH